MYSTRILGIMVYDRIKEAGRTQEVLTRYADIIKTRLGFHELSENVCSRIGTILIVLKGDQQKWDALENEIAEIGGVEIQKMQFGDHNHHLH
ncbi:MAG: hypothetical protein ACLFQS_02325 [Bacteroidales bacterium]